MGGGLEWAWDGVVATLSAAASQSNDNANVDDTNDAKDTNVGGDRAVATCGAVAALLAVNAASDILAQSPPSSTPWRIRVGLLDVLSRAYASAREANSMGRTPGNVGEVARRRSDAGARRIRLEVTAGELLLESLESELAEVRGSVGRMAPAEASTRSKTLASRLRSHVVEVLAVTSAGYDNTGAQSGHKTSAAATAAAATEDRTDDVDGSIWLERSTAARAERAFREPLAAAALEVIADLEGDEFTAAVEAALPSIVALVAVGRQPVSGALAALFAGPLAQRMSSLLR